MNTNLSVTSRPTLDITTMPQKGPGIGLDESQPPEGLVRREDVPSGQLPTNPGKVREEGGKDISRPTKLENFKKPNILIRALAMIPEICANIVLLGMPAIMKAMEGKEPPTPFTVQLPGTNGRTVELDGHIGPKKIPKGMTHEQVQTRLQQKIDDGYKVYTAVMNGDREGGCTVSDMTNLMFFLQARAEDKQGACFKDGAFSLPDPGNRLRKFLDSCPEAYQRSSSFAPGEGHRGIDARGSGKKLDQLLPHHLTSLHYCTLPSSDTLPEDRIYLKMEPHGKFLSRPQSGADPEGPSRSMNRHDFGASFKHVFSSLKTPGEVSFTERLPAAVKNDYRELLRQMPESARQMLSENQPFSRTGGIRVMLDNAMALLQHDALSEPEDKLTDEAREKLVNFVKRLHQEYPSPEVRFGNEVIFSSEELISAPEVEITGPITPQVSVNPAMGQIESFANDAFTKEVEGLRKNLQSTLDGLAPPHPPELVSLLKALDSHGTVVEGEPMALGDLFSDEVPTIPKETLEQWRDQQSEFGDLLKKGLEDFAPKLSQDDVNFTEIQQQMAALQKGIETVMTKLV